MTENKDLDSDRVRKRPLDTSPSGSSDESADEFSSPTLQKRTKLDQDESHPDPAGLLSPLGDFTSANQDKATRATSGKQSPAPGDDDDISTTPPSTAVDQSVLDQAKDTLTKTESEEPQTDPGISAETDKDEDKPSAGGRLERSLSACEEAKLKEQMEEEKRQKKQILVDSLSEVQLNRYEMYRRASFPKAAVKRFMQSITGCSASHNVVIAMSGIAKVYVGEIVEEALDVLDLWGDSGPLQPKHIREGVRRLKMQDKVPSSKGRKALFR